MSVYIKNLMNRGYDRLLFFIMVTAMLLMVLGAGLFSVAVNQRIAEEEKACENVRLKYAAEGSLQYFKAALKANPTFSPNQVIAALGPHVTFSSGLDEISCTLESQNVTHSSKHFDLTATANDPGGEPRRNVACTARIYQEGLIENDQSFESL